MLTCPQRHANRPEASPICWCIDLQPVSGTDLAVTLISKCGGMSGSGVLRHHPRQRVFVLRFGTPALGPKRLRSHRRGRLNCFEPREADDAPFHEASFSNACCIAHAGGNTADAAAPAAWRSSPLSVGVPVCAAATPTTGHSRRSATHRAYGTR